MKLKFGIVVIFAVLISACSKDEQKTKTELLTLKAWKLNAYKVVDSQGTEMDYYAYMQQSNDCNLDNTMLFATDGTLTVNEGTNVCNDSTYMFKSGTWSLTPDEKQIKIFEENGYYSFSLTELSESKMTIETTGSVSKNGSISLKSANATYTFKLTYTH